MLNRQFRGILETKHSLAPRREAIYNVKGRHTKRIYRLFEVSRKILANVGRSLLRSIETMAGLKGLILCPSLPYSGLVSFRPHSPRSRHFVVALSETDRNLLERCLAKRPRAWENFVDRFMGLVLHVINHTAHCRSVHLNSADREDLVAEVMLTIIQDDFAVLRRFRGNSSLATYLTVITRRVVVRKLIETRSATPLGEMAENAASSDNDFEQRISNHEEVERLLKQLNGNEADVVRLYHLEGKSYQEISRIVGIPTNSVGPLLTRVRTKLRGMPHA